MIALIAVLASPLAGACEVIGTLEPGRGGLVPSEACGSAAAPDGCGAACTADVLCAPGLYCAAGVCTADCVSGQGAFECATGERCTERGRCAPLAALEDAGPGVDGGEECAGVTLEADARIPTVLFVVDRSTSMTWEFRDADVSRWDALRDALFGSGGAGGGVIPALEDRVRFGMSLYTGDPLPPDVECPLIRGVAPAFGNAAALRTLYQRNTPVADSSTPTAQSIDLLVAQTPLSDEGPTLFVLATDGLPDTCEEPTERDERARRLSVEAVVRAREAGIETRVLSLADFGEKHVQDLANAGAGLPVRDRYGAGDPLAEAYAPGDTAGLQADLGRIVGAALSCEIDLQGRIDTTRACDGTVLLDGRAVACDEPGGGWRVVDEDTIELLGSACAELESGSVRRLEASFPCGVVLI